MKSYKMPSTAIHNECETRARRTLSSGGADDNFMSVSRAVCSMMALHSLARSAIRIHCVTRRTAPYTTSLNERGGRERDRGRGRSNFCLLLRPRKKPLAKRDNEEQCLPFQVITQSHAEGANPTEIIA